MLHIPKLPPTYITKSPPPPLLQAYMHARGMTSSLALSAYKESQLLFPARHINLTTAVNRVYNYSEKKSKLLGTFFCWKWGESNHKNGEQRVSNSQTCTQTNRPTHHQFHVYGHTQTLPLHFPQAKPPNWTHTTTTIYTRVQMDYGFVKASRAKGSKNTLFSSLIFGFLFYRLGVIGKKLESKPKKGEKVEGKKRTSYTSPIECSSKCTSLCVMLEGRKKGPLFKFQLTCSKHTETSLTWRGKKWGKATPVPGLNENFAQFHSWGRQKKTFSGKLLL